MERRLHRQLILAAQQQYKLSLAVKLHCARNDNNAFEYLGVYAYGMHTADQDELSLTPDQERFASAAFEHSSIYIMAVQIDTALADCFEDRLHSENNDIFNASWIARLIRNSFAHDPFNPVWLTYPECDNTEYIIDNIISLDTTNKNGNSVQRDDYRGPLALFRFAEHVRTEILID